MKKVVIAFCLLGVFSVFAETSSDAKKVTPEQHNAILEECKKLGLAGKELKACIKEKVAALTSKK